MDRSRCNGSEVACVSCALAFHMPLLAQRTLLVFEGEIAAIVGPAVDGPVDAQSARVIARFADHFASRYGGELALWCLPLSVAAITPADDGFVDADSTRQIPASGDGGVCAFRHFCLSKVVLSPAIDGLVNAQPALVAPTGCHGNKSAV